MKPTRTWIVIANGARARILLNNGPGKGVEQLEGMDFRDAHPPARERGTDRPGRVFDSHGSGRHAVDDGDAGREAERRFLGDLVGVLQHHFDNQAFDRLIIVAPPTALGMLRDEIEGPLSETISGDIDKDLTAVPNNKIADRLGSVLAV